MQILDDPELVTGRDYFQFCTQAWKWGDETRWWEVFVEFSGLNGGAGLWLIEKWRWNGSPDFLRRDIRSLSYEESRRVIQQVVRFIETGVQETGRQESDNPEANAAPPKDVKKSN